MRRLLSVVVLVLAACDGAERRDAEAVIGAVSRYRSADEASKPAMMDALKGTPCNAPDACNVKTVCLAMAEPTANALRRRAEVARAISEIEKGTLEPDAAAAQELPKKLDEAEALFKQGRDNLGPCDEAVQALKRKFRL